MFSLTPKLRLIYVVIAIPYPLANLQGSNHNVHRCSPGFLQRVLFFSESYVSTPLSKLTATVNPPSPTRIQGLRSFLLEYNCW